MTALSRNISIPDSKLEIMVIRIRDAGGQHVNKTSVATRLCFDIRVSSPPEHYKKRLLAANHRLISSGDIIVTKAQEYRSQELNREAAIFRLAVMIRELTTVQKSRRAARPTHVPRERRLSSKA